jgi:hypothetical protein
VGSPKHGRIRTCRGGLYLGPRSICSAVFAGRSGRRGEVQIKCSVTLGAGNKYPPSTHYCPLFPPCPSRIITYPPCPPPHSTQLSPASPLLASLIPTPSPVSSLVPGILNTTHPPSQACLRKQWICILTPLGVQPAREKLFQNAS